MKSFIAATLLTALSLSSVTAQKTADPESAISAKNRNIHIRAGLPNLKRAIGKNERCHVAFLGGSITENKTGHTAGVPAWLRSEFPAVEFSFTNAGVSSTCSTTGAFRISTDVFGGEPVDLLIVEFAVNDDQDGAHAQRECVRGMEGIVRQVRRDQPECDVVMVHYVNPSMLEKIGRGEVPISIAAHESVAERYAVSSVNIAAEVSDAVKAGRYAWKDYGGTHPGKFGYQVASNMIVTALKAGLAKEPAADEMPDPIDPESYSGGRFIEVSKAEPSAGWKVGKVGRDLLPVGSIRGGFLPLTILRGGSAGDELTLKFEGRAVGAYVLAGPDAGIVETKIDDGEFSKHDLYHKHSRGLNYPRSVVFASGLRAGKHTLTLRIASERNTQSKGEHGFNSILRSKSLNGATLIAFGGGAII